MKFKKINSKPDFPKLEERILRFWQKKKIVEKYLHRNDQSRRRFSFLDGPITANNPMGVHHAHGRTLKDFFQRYKNMQGYRQRFQNGFDCQGLWLEVEEEKEKGFNSKREIESYGVEKFCRDCRARVEKFSKIQAKQSQRLGMFMDWENSYYTFSDQNNEYIWYFLKRCWEKGWLYYGFDSLPWCARCGTAISQHELSDEGWKEVKHKAVYVKFKLKTPFYVKAASFAEATSAAKAESAARQNSKLKTTAQNLKLKDLYFLAWTTTPWTLSSNTAIAVHPELSYVLATGDFEGNGYILAKAAAERLKLQITQEFKGEELLGLQYESLYSEFASQKDFEHIVIPWKEIAEEEGSGIVHIAPGAGKEDFELSKKFKLKVIGALDENGIFQEGFGFLTGKSALEVSDEVIADLEKRNRLFAVEDIIHSYPHCWRCKQELVFRASQEWFIKTGPIRGKLKKEAQKVNWIPKFAGLRMQDWLSNMGDWPISRKRYWGLALPFWICQKCGELIVVGSKKELRERAIDPSQVDRLPELHRPWLDGIKIKCAQCQAEAIRVKDVGDCWLDAGIVPFSTIKYLEDKNYFKKWYPFEFITEYIAQVKLWFYSTLFMSVVLGGKAPWKNVLATGFVVDEKGEAMHKSKGNVIWFDEAVQKMGADVMRWVYLKSPASSEATNLRFGYAIADEARKRFFLILWNVYNFFVTYVRLDGWTPTGRQNSKLSLLDKWIISRMNSLVELVTDSLDNYHTPVACRAIEEFVSDLSTWYVRRSRERAGPGAKGNEDKNALYQTLYRVLLTLSELMAAFAPFFSEEFYQNLNPGRDSVHLEGWPRVSKNLIDPKLEKKMSLIRQAASLGHNLRKQAGIKVRQPLAALKIKNQKVKIKKSPELLSLLQEELNIRKVEVVEDFKEERGWRRGKEGDWEATLDTRITDELKEEGWTREVLRHLQELRKEAGCRPGDRVRVRYFGEGELNRVLSRREKLILEKTASTEFKLGKPPLALDAEKEIVLDGQTLWLGIKKL